MALKRSGMPCRTTGLTRTGKGLERTELKSRTKPIKRTLTKATRRDTGPRKPVLAVIDKRSGGQCEFPHCPLPREERHHRLPRRMGGSSNPLVNQASNVIGLCAGHHGWVESNREAAMVFGLILPAGSDPRLVPVVLRHHTGAVLLDDEGGWRVAPE
jgi:5-methylcytosine-specific restriction protein A